MLWHIQLGRNLSSHKCYENNILLVETYILKWKPGYSKSFSSLIRNSMCPKCSIGDNASSEEHNNVLRNIKGAVESN